MSVNLKGLTATISAQFVLIQALCVTHPDRAKLRQVFGELMSGQIASETDPQIAGRLHAFEEAAHSMLA